MQATPARLKKKDSCIKMLVYGNNGTRKTTFASTWPGVLWIDTNHGLSVIENGEDHLVFAPEGRKDLATIMKWLTTQDTKDIHTIVIDSMDNLALLLLNEVVEDGYNTKRSNDPKVVISLRSELVPEQGDYNANRLQVYNFLHDLAALHKHIIIISASFDGTKYIGPALPISISNLVCDFVDVVGEMQVFDQADMKGETDPNLYAGCGVMVTLESKTRRTKSRIREIKPYIVDPTYDKIMELMKGQQ